MCVRKFVYYNDKLSVLHSYMATIEPVYYTDILSL